MSYFTRSTIFLRIVALLLLVLAGSMFGCGGRPKPSGLPKLQPCQVVVTQQGTPLVGAAVSFRSVSGTDAWMISGRTDASGKADLTTQIFFAGVPVGEYRVLVSKMETDTSALTPPPADMLEREKWQEGQNKIKCPTYSFVQQEYDSFDKTPLSATVKTGKNQFSFEAGEPVKTKL